MLTLKEVRTPKVKFHQHIRSTEVVLPRKSLCTEVVITHTLRTGVVLACTSRTVVVRTLVTEVSHANTSQMGQEYSIVLAARFWTDTSIRTSTEYPRLIIMATVCEPQLLNNIIMTVIMAAGIPSSPTEGTLWFLLEAF